ncbi:MAG: XRE family transcriptional regulator [Gemmatimonadaceae bacterium]|nr:XRE family transcriptional regulator [Gemmatimonadaceae bacterium]
MKVEHSCGNVFADMGLPNPEELLAKAELAIVITHIIHDSGLTQRLVATKLGVAASDVSDLMRGRFARFSQERLERFLNKLDHDVHIQIAPRPKSTRRPARVTVERVAAF